MEKTVKAAENLIDAQTDYTVTWLDSLETVNRQQTGKYKQLAESTKGLENDREYLEGLNNENARYVDQLKQVRGHLDTLEKLVGEVDEWSKELEVKVRRMNQDKSSSGGDRSTPRPWTR